MSAPVPSGWAARVLEPHLFNLTAALLVGGVPVAALPPILYATTAGTLSLPSAVQPFAVTTSATATAAWSLTCAFADPLGTLNDQLAPTGAEIALTASIDDGNGGWLSIPYGVFGITVTGTVNTDTPVGAPGSDFSSSSVGPVLNITGQDRSQVISASKLVDTVQFPAGISLAAATYQLIHSQVPWIPGNAYRLADGGAILLPSQIVDVDADPWATAKTWWANVGLRLSIDRQGNIVGGSAVPIPVPTRSFGPSDGLVGVTNNEDATQSYNGVTVIGSFPGNVPVRATAWDENPASATWVGGPFGRRPATSITVATATTVEQCYAAAAARLPLMCGLSQTMTLDVAPDRSIDPWDVISVTSPDDGIEGELRQVTGYVDTGGQQMSITTIPLSLAIPVPVSVSG